MPDDIKEWEDLFEHPKTGFISLVGQAHSTDALKQIAVVIISKLLSHKGEEGQLKHHIEQLQKISKEDSSDIEKMRDDVTSLLREVKEERKQAMEKEKRPKKAKPAPKKKAPPSEKPKKKKKKKPGPGFSFAPLMAKITKVHLVILGCLVVLLIAGGVWGWFVLGDKAAQALEAEKAATIQFVQDHLNKNRPSKSWEVKAVEFKGEGTIAVDMMILDEHEVKAIVSQKPEARKRSVESLCPPNSEAIAEMLENQWKLWISLRSTRFNITSSGCNY
ncbi:MAG: hypothetical protein OQJ97_13065 [Rhodospirillales bacterium]|nr:hypothetical protein [Rhodospirillales bacterium]